MRASRSGRAATPWIRARATGRAEPPAGARVLRARSRSSACSSRTSRAAGSGASPRSPTTAGCRPLSRGREPRAVGQGCGAFAEAARSGRARMIIGEERAVTDLWSAAAASLPDPREDRPGQPVFVIDEPPEPGETTCGRPRWTTWSCSCPPRAQRTSRRSASTRSSGTPRASAGARGRRSRRAGRGSGSRAGRSSSRRRRRPGRRRAVQLQQVWVDPARAATATPSGACATSAGSCSTDADRLPLRPPRERAGDPRSTRRSACSGRSLTAASSSEWSTRSSCVTPRAS